MATGLVVVDFVWHHSIARPRKPPATCKNLADISYTSRARISCLLDLSAAFDHIDHNILITRLSSWFGIHGSVLNWFKSYPALSVLNVIKTSLPSIFLPVVFLKALFSVLYFLSCILPHSALSTPHFLLTITFMQMILNFFLDPSSQLWLKYRPLPDCSETHLLLDVCKSSYS